MSNGTDMDAAKEKDIRQRFCKILRQTQDLGLSVGEIDQLASFRNLNDSLKVTNKGTIISNVITKVWNFICGHYLLIILSFLAVVTLTGTVAFADFPISKRSILNAYFYVSDLNIEEEPCLLETAEAIVDMTRPPVDCSMCIDIKEVDYVSDISPYDFETDYAYSGRPVVIKDGMKNWTAPQHFSFKFFQGIYALDSPALENIERNCQFFPYKTNFDSLGEVFNMSDERAQMKEGSEPWYIGWSNCDLSAANVLRQHYDRPYFLPKVAESSRTDWIFMGSPGYGAHMHIDNVGNPSWQAQITGTKLWTLEPPPECYLSCEKRLEVTVRPGEIIVLDTNIWYHSTKVISEDMSITIGSEYD